MPGSKPRRKDTAGEWQQLFKKCLLANTSLKAFEGEVLRKVLKAPLDGVGVVEAWSGAHDNGFTVRSRQTKYFDHMLHLKIYSHEDVLQAIKPMIKNTVILIDDYFIKTGVAKGEYKQCIEAVMLERLAYNLLNIRTLELLKHDRTIDFRIYKPLMALISTYLESINSVPMLQGPALSIGLELGKFLGVFINDLSVSGILTSSEGGPPRGMKKEFGRLLSQFIPIITAGSAEVGQSLTLLQQQSGLHQEQDTEQANDGMADGLRALNFQQSVGEIAFVTTRAALYVFLNSMLAACPIADDASLYAFLNSRYSGNVSLLINDLIIASFDVLANAINRSEPSDSISVCRCFLINKIPVLLQSFSGMLFPPTTIESCITGALRSLDPSADLYPNQSFDLLSSSGMLSEARQEFLFACALYGLIPESSIEKILGDVPMQSLPDSGKYDRSDLVAQCTTNPSRIEELVNELENFEGQAAEISAALTQIIRDCCAGRDSVTLKGICNALSRKTQALYVLLLFEHPSTFLQPLCQLLDHWQDSEDHSESHPVYDEFGSIFLLVIVFKQRLDLQFSDLGITYPDSFMRKYLMSGCTPLSPSSFTEIQKTQFGGWVKGLYESEGLSDDFVSSCSPKDFHLLVATLFDQSLKATSAGLLTFESVKGGFEYLLEPFLIPSLVTGLGFAARKLWETQATAPHLDTFIPLLSLLIRPSTLSPEAKILHETVLSTVAAQLTNSLVHVDKLHPRRQDIQPLLNFLRSRASPSRASFVSHTELEAWTVGNPGGFPHSLRHALHALVMWSARCAAAGGSGNSMPPAYTHRQVVAAVRMLGATVVLSTLLDEARRLMAGPSHDGASVAGSTAGHSAGHSAAAAAGGGGSSTAASGPGAGPPTGPATGVHSMLGAAAFDTEIVLDVLAAVVCAPLPDTGRNALSLRDALQAAAEEAWAASKTDGARAELVVRLLRRVDMQTLTPADGTVPGVGGGVGVGGGGAMHGTGMDGTGMDGAGMDGAGMDGSGMGGSGMDAGPGLDVDAAVAAAVSGGARDAMEADLLMGMGADGGGVGMVGGTDSAADGADAGGLGVAAPDPSAPSAGMDLDDLDVDAIGAGLDDSDFQW